MDAFTELDEGMGKVAALKSLNWLISKRIGRDVLDMKIEKGRWLCFVPGLGWRQSTELLTQPFER